MAKVTYKNKTIEVKDGANITYACERLGVNVSCRAGICGICRIEILSGMENLNEKTEEEKELELDGRTRLACECVIKSGEVKIDF